jgi:hypothetical protein
LAVSYLRLCDAADHCGTSFFNTQSMVLQYLADAWFREEGAGAAVGGVART